MANRYAVVTGNWSSASTWDGGTLPGPTDVVRANGFTVTINQNITVAELRTDAGGGAAAGGLFIAISYIAYGVTANCHAGTSSCLQLYYGELTGNAYGGTASSAYGVNLARGATMKGNAYGGIASLAYGAKSGYGATIRGDAYGGIASTAYGANLDYGGVLIGGVQSSSTAYGAYSRRGGVVHTNDIVSTSGKKVVYLANASSVVLYGSATDTDITKDATSTIYTPEEYYGDLWPSGGGSTTIIYNRRNTAMRPTAIKKGNTLKWIILTLDSSDTLIDADSLPSATVRSGGADVTPNPTVTNVGTGIYEFSWDPTGEIEGQDFTIIETATIDNKVNVNQFSVKVIVNERGTDGAAKAADILETPGNKLATNNSGEVIASNMITPATPATAADIAAETKSAMMIGAGKIEVNATNQVTIDSTGIGGGGGSGGITETELTDAIEAQTITLTDTILTGTRLQTYTDEEATEGNTMVVSDRHGQQSIANKITLVRGEHTVISWAVARQPNGLLNYGGEIKTMSVVERVDTHAASELLVVMQGIDHANATLEVDLTDAVVGSDYKLQCTITDDDGSSYVLAAIIDIIPVFGV